MKPHSLSFIPWLDEPPLSLHCCIKTPFLWSNSFLNSGQKLPCILGNTNVFFYLLFWVICIRDLNNNAWGLSETGNPCHPLYHTTEPVLHTLVKYTSTLFALFYWDTFYMKQQFSSFGTETTVFISRVLTFFVTRYVVHSILHTGFLIPDAWCSILDAWYWMLDTQIA